MEMYVRTCERIGARADVDVHTCGQRYCEKSFRIRIVSPSTRVDICVRTCGHRFVRMDAIVRTHGRWFHQHIVPIHAYGHPYGRSEFAIPHDDTVHTYEQ
jgi:hypothetical protein